MVYFLRRFGRAFYNFAVFFSFIMNFVLVIVLIVVVQQIFMIKNGIAEPLIDGLHGSFVGLNDAVIVTQIPVNDSIPIDFDLTVEDNTVVTLTDDVVINNVPAVFFISGGGGTITGAVNITLPEGAQLPVSLKLIVPVEQTIPIAINVPVNIPLEDTELSPAFQELRLLFEPFVLALDNLPSNWNDVPSFFFDSLNGKVNLLRETDASRNPWPLRNSRLPQTLTPSASDTNTSNPVNTLTPEPEQSVTPQPVAPNGTPNDDPTAVPTATLTPYPTLTPSMGAN
ncbi:MAG: hypothetical protein H6673_13010 [Anaerolineales bacterium]|nr:hypothetical protein [Anaerolineales bacterium]